MVTATKTKTKKKEKKRTAIPLGNNVLVELLLTDETEGGIILPREDAHTGVIQAIGGGVDDTYVGDESGCRSRGLSIGDVVYLPKGQKVGELIKSYDGEKVYLVVPPQYIAFIREGK